VFFTNQGYPGWTTAAWQPGTDQFKSAEADATRLQAQHPGQLVFSIMLGTNDASAQGPPGSPIEPDAYGKNMRAIVDKLMADFSDAKIVINEGPWFSPNTHNSADYEGEVVAARMRGYSPVIEAVVKDWAGSHTGHVFLGDTQAYDYFGRHFQTEMVQENGRDGIFYLHPNVQGGATLGKFWAIAIAKDLKP
jgi:lysophospholipase L1-like esterase